jgi:hypothetical protein
MNLRRHLFHPRQLHLQVIALGADNGVMNAVGDRELVDAGLTSNTAYPIGGSDSLGADAAPAVATPAGQLPAPVGEIPEILQLVPATGWWVDRPTIDEDTGAVMNNRGRAIAFALCKFSTGVEVRPIDDAGHIVTCGQLQHESDAGLISKYKKRARAKPGDAEDKGNPAPNAAGGSRGPSQSEKPDEMSLRHLKAALFEGLQWVSAILDKDPGDELLRHCRQQLRWMQSAVENERRPTISELGQLTLTAKIVPELSEDDPYLAEMLTEIEDLYRDL